uniref:Fork head domain transcription factor slp2 n=1 Tax=Bactrocera latifrons TaxID=174628 RepID=A0A0K8U641_BACLA
MQSSKFFIRSLLADTNIFDDMEMMPPDKEEIKVADQPANNPPVHEPYHPESYECRPQLATNTRMTYSHAIATAIRASSEKMLPLKDIYKWIEENCPYIFNNNDNWKDTVRHNLSHNKLFVRVARPANKPGRGKFWAVDAAQESKNQNRMKNKAPASRKTVLYPYPPRYCCPVYPPTYTPSVGQFWYLPHQFVPYPNNYYTIAI